jgi:hypothetical protein
LVSGEEDGETLGAAAALRVERASEATAALSVAASFARSFSSPGFLFSHALTHHHATRYYYLSHSVTTTIIVPHSHKPIDRTSPQIETKRKEELIERRRKISARARGMRHLAAYLAGPSARGVMQSLLPAGR